MPKNKSLSPRKGRGLELLVKRIKEHQSPGTIVRSPVYVADIDTGQQREVDIGVHVPKDGGVTFIAIECRDRGTTQDVEWIEQLISKKNSIGADVLVAITSSNFTKPARVKALKHGVILGEMTRKLPEMIAQLATSILMKLRYLCPRILQVDLQIPPHINNDLDSYKYKHKLVEQPLSLYELAQVWSNPNLIRTIPKLIKNWQKDKFAEITLAEVNADVIYGDQLFPIQSARISYELGYGEMELPLQVVQELSVLDRLSDMDAIVYSFGTKAANLSEVIVDVEADTLRWDLLCKGMLEEGKVLIGAELKASKPLSITTMRLDI